MNNYCFGRIQAQKNSKSRMSESWITNFNSQQRPEWVIKARDKREALLRRRGTPPPTEQQLAALNSAKEQIDSAADVVKIYSEAEHVKNTLLGIGIQLHWSHLASDGAKCYTYSFF